MCVCVYVCEFYDFSGGNSVPIRRDVKDSLFPQGEKNKQMAGGYEKQYFRMR